MRANDRSYLNVSFWMSLLSLVLIIVFHWGQITGFFHHPSAVVDDPFEIIHGVKAYLYRGDAFGAAEYLGQLVGNSEAVSYLPVIAQAADYCYTRDCGGGKLNMTSDELYFVQASPTLKLVLVFDREGQGIYRLVDLDIDGY